MYISNLYRITALLIEESRLAIITIVTEALRATGGGHSVEPVIEIHAEALPGRTDVATEIPLREHAIEVGLS